MARRRHWWRRPFSKPPWSVGAPSLSGWWRFADLPTCCTKSESECRHHLWHADSIAEQLYHFALSLYVDGNIFAVLFYFYPRQHNQIQWDDDCMHLQHKVDWPWWGTLKMATYCGCRSGIHLWSKHWLLRPPAPWCDWRINNEKTIFA